MSRRQLAYLRRHDDKDRAEADHIRDACPGTVCRFTSEVLTELPRGLSPSRSMQMDLMTKRMEESLETPCPTVAVAPDVSDEDTVMGGRLEAQLSADDTGSFRPMEESAERKSRPRRAKKTWKRARGAQDLISSPPKPTALPASRADKKTRQKAKDALRTARTTVIRKGENGVGSAAGASPIKIWSALKAFNEGLAEEDEDIEELLGLMAEKTERM